jgi:uncharacterized membrane protein
MRIRSARERALQTLWYEFGGLAVITPLYGLATGHTGGSSLVLLAAVALACMVWAAVHNTVFDWIDLQLTGRVASDRPQHLRMVHAASHEVSSIIVSTPVIMLIGGYGLWAALLIDIGLTLAYTAYAYVFHIVYDRLRPVERTTLGKRRTMTSTFPSFPQRPHHHSDLMTKPLRGT